MPRPKKPAAPATNTDDFADILGESGAENPGPLPGSDNMPDIPIEAEPPVIPVATAETPAEVPAVPSAPVEAEVTAEVENVKQKTGYLVTTEFRDIVDFSFTHRAGADVSHFPSDRLERLLTLGYVKEV